MHEPCQGSKILTGFFHKVLLESICKLSRVPGIKQRWIAGVNGKSSGPKKFKYELAILG